MYDKLIKELKENKVVIDVELDWRNTYDSEDFLFDHLPSFDITFDVSMQRKVDIDRGSYTDPPSFTVTDEKKNMMGIKVYEKEYGSQIELNEKQLETVSEYLCDIMKIY